MQRKEILLIVRKEREKWAKYQKNMVLKGDLYME